MDLIIVFPDQSKSFTYGVEYGRILQQMESGVDVVMNSGFPVRLENVELIKTTCQALGYVPSFWKIYFEEWIEFIGIKRKSTNN